MTAVQVSLTPRGRALLAGGLLVLLIAASAGLPVLAASAALMLGVVSAGWFAARRLAAAAAALTVHLETPGGPTRARGEAIDVLLWLTHPGARPLGEVDLTLRVGGEPAPACRRTIHVPARGRGALSFPLRFPRAGHWFVHGVELRLTAPLGAAEAVVYRPCELALGVRPRRLPDRLVNRLLTRRGAPRERAGRHLSRQPGSGLELRELRDYVPGDPLKTVAWRATARRQRPLVRSFEEENTRRVQLLLDIGPTMRAGALGEAPLDRAIDLCASIAEIGVEDRIGLTSFDHRVYGHLKPGGGRGHVQRQLRHLMDLSRVVDEDLTEVTDAELMARVGAFLEAQHARSLRRAGDDPRRPRVARTLVDPLAELYDSGALYAEITTYLARERDRGHEALFAKARPAKSTLSARLRLFCALRGLPVAYRLTGAADAAEQGLVDAVGRNLTPGGADRLMLFTDLRGLRPDGPALRALRLARAHKKDVLVVPLGPEPPGHLLTALDAAGARVARS